MPPPYFPFAAPGTLEIEAVAYALAGLATPSVRDPAELQRAIDRASQVSETRLGGRGVAYWVGSPAVTVRPLDPWAQAEPWSPLFCEACERQRVECAHTLAVRLVLHWQQPSARTALQTPAWRQALGGLVSGGAEADRRRAAGPTHEGWVRYEIFADTPPGVTGKSALDRLLTRHIVKRSKRSGEPLGPIQFPKKLEDAESKVTLTDTDRELDRYFQELRTLESLVAHRWQSPDGRTLRVLDDLLGRALLLLVEVQDLQFDGTPVFTSREPVRPRLVVDDAPADDGVVRALALRWSPPLRAMWDAGPGFVLTRENTFQPLHRDTAPEVRARLHTPLPCVPLAAAGEFLRDVVLKTSVPVDLKARNLPHLRGNSAPPTPRLRLAEVDGVLSVSPSFVYTDAEHVRELAVDDLSPWVLLGETAGTPRMAERDTAREAAALDALAPLAPGPYPASLTGDAALDLLFEVASEGAAIKTNWEVLFDPKLAGTRAVGRFTPKIGVDSGIDWFDVDVSFHGEGRAKATLGVLIAAWRAGRRFVRLSNGAIGRIPSEWLSRHGETLEQLQEMKAASDGKLRAFAAPLAAELLGEQGLPDSLQRWRAIGERIRAFTRVPEWPLPAGVNATLRDYQLRGFHWLIWLRDLDLGGVLADDMGLGKTLQALALLLDTHAEPGGSPSLVVAPTSVVHNWIAEAARFTPELRVHLHHGGARAKSFPADADVIVTSYALLRQDEALFRETRFRYAILDEAQAIKNPTSLVTQACHALQSDYRLAVTGTPLENNLVELWSLFQFLMPGFFGGRTAFNSRFTTPIQKRRDDEAMAALRARIRPFVLRRRKDEVAKELPPRTEQILYCELDPTQRRLYESVKDTYRDQVLNKVDQQGLGRATIQVLEALTRLRQCCCDPRLLPFEEARAVTTSAKRTLLIDTLDEIVAEGHRTLIFSQWPSLLRLVEADLVEGHIPYLYLDGSTVDRKSLVTRWNAPDGPPVFLISLKAGGTGLNLTGADHVIHLDPWWNPAVEAQATDRAHRIGQTKPVMVYKLVARDTVEEKILELQARKRALFDATVDADAMLVDTLTRDDLATVFAPGR